MDWLNHNWVNIALASIVLVLVLPRIIRSWSVKQVSPIEATELVNRQQALVLDVRNGVEVAGGRLPGAMHIPLGELESRLAELEAWRNKPIIVNCQMGGRSLSACQILKNHGFSDIYNLKGGIAAWRQANLPVQRQ